MKSESENKLRIRGWLYVLLFLAVFVLTWTLTGHCQVSVQQAPPLHFQFLNASGTPLANGKIFTYIAGTTTLQNTYVDGTGTTQNLDPIPLDSTGSPSNGSTQTSIFLSNASWKFVAYDSNNVFQWSVDQVTTIFAILNTANTWTATQTFSAQIIDTLIDNQIVTGAPTNQTTLDFPPPASNITLHFPATGDTVVGRATTDTLTNKTLTSPTINNGTITNATINTPTVNSVSLANSPGTYAAIANANPGTVTNALAKIVNAPSQVTVPAVTDISGAIGICNSACGNSGTAQIQSSGTASCVFDAGVTAGDYVTISATVAGDCHDAGAAYLTQAQMVGRVLVTNVVAGTYSVLLYGGDVKIPNQATTITVVNNGATGTTNATITKLTGTPSTAVISTVGDTGGAIGITTSGGGTVGSASIQLNGIVNCAFDGATTANDYVQISATVAGQCHDVGGTYPGSGQIIGRVLSTNGASGTYQIILFGQEIKGGGRFFSVGGCTPASSTDSQCTGTISISPAFPDANYIPILTVNNNGTAQNAALSIAVNGALTSSSIPYTMTCTFFCSPVNAPTIYVYAAHQ